MGTQTLKACLLLVFIFVNISIVTSIADKGLTINPMKATILVFSGTENPSIELNTDQMKHIRNLLSENIHKPNTSTRVMGYQGFAIHLANNSNTFNIVKGAPSVELYVLGLMKPSLSKEVVDHIRHIIDTGYTLTGNYHDDIPDVPSSNYDCEATPITGPDSIPVFDPKTDNYGCYLKKQYDNNCYNYSTDIVTNTFAQPGRGTSQKWQQNTCEDVQRAALSDGLKWVGREYPSSLPESGHYVSLHIWPGTNFHWLRLDQNGKWSHKPGGTAIKNTDNKGGNITDPSSQDFSPWSQFCGYFLVLPSSIKID